MTTVTTERPPRRKQQRRLSRKLYGLTEEQARAYHRLYLGIRAATEAELGIPCLQDRRSFDRRPGSPQQAEDLRLRCLACPVFDACDAYRKTGVPLFGVVAGRVCNEGR